MCKNCENPDSVQGRAVRAFMNALGKQHSETYIINKSKKLHALNDPRVSGSPAFTPDLDTMPDGVHAKPYKFWAKVKTFRRGAREDDDLKAEHHAKKLLNQYRQLKIEPKPEFFEWASSQPGTRFMLFESMLRNAIAGKNPTDQTKASSGILEYSKVKPKQTIEVSQAVPQGEISELFRQIAQLGGIPQEAVETFIGAYLAKSPSAN